MYTDKIEALRVNVVLAQDRFSRAQAFLDAWEVSQAEATLLRAQKMLDRAILCNDVLERLRCVGKMGDLRSATNAVLNANEFTVEEMQALVYHGPEWGNHLYVPDLHFPEKPASLYQIEIIRKSDQEAFYKVGHTGVDLNRRINALGICRKTYSVSVHHAIKFRKKRFAESEEKRLHEQNTSLRYLGESFLNNGHTEVYTQPILSNRLLLEISLYSLLGISRD